MIAALSIPLALASAADDAGQRFDNPVADGPIDSDAFRSAQTLLPTFQVVESARFVIVTDAEESWVREQVETLEATCDEFNRFLGRLGATIEEPPEKMVCVMFARREDYRAFAQEHDGVQDPSIAGYYSPASRRLVVYHPGEAPAAAALQQRLERDRGQLNALHAQPAATLVSEGAAGILAREALVRRIDRNAALLHDFVRRVSAATIIHEAVHMLAFQSHLQSPFVQYPLWVSEGLATAFETDRPDRMFGPDVESKSRREIFIDLLRRDGLLDLESLAVVTSISSHGSEESRVVYHQGAALVAWLVRFRRSEFASYLEAMRLEHAGRPSPARHIQILEAHLGDLETLETDWLRWEHARAGLAGRGAAPDAHRPADARGPSPSDHPPE